ncbi:hypothetical protein HDV05_000457, partial [Chytridiales sp. JEL 0842]
MDETQPQNFSPPVNTPLPILNFWNALPNNDRTSIVDDSSLLHAFLSHQDATMHALQRQLQQQQEVLQQQHAALGDLQHAQQVTAAVTDSAHGTSAPHTTLQPPPQHQHHQINGGSSSASGSGVAAGSAPTAPAAASAALDEQQITVATLAAAIRRLESKTETSKTKLKIRDPDPFRGDRLQVNSYLAQLQLAFEANPSAFPSERQKLVYAVSYLRDDAF